jgi:polar amino acid transport system permease protein
MPALIGGTVETVRIFALTLVLALPLGLPIALCALSRRWPLKAFSTVYVWLFRGTPLMLQLFFVYYALPLFSPIMLDRFPSAVLTFVLNYAAYFAEIYRAGIQSIDRGQFEACVSLGYTRSQTMRLIILPQVVRRILPPVSNEVITLVKDTALVAAIAVPELLKSAKDAANRDVKPTAYAVAAAIYLVLTMALTFFSRLLEKRFSRHEEEVA